MQVVRQPAGAGSSRRSPTAAGAHHEETMVHPWFDVFGLMANCGGGCDWIENEQTMENFL